MKDDFAFYASRLAAAIGLLIIGIITGIAVNGIRAEESPETPGIQEPSVTLTVDKATVELGAAVMITWEVTAGEPSAKDWVALYKAGEPENSTNYTWWVYTSAARNTGIAVTMPTSPGTYEFRYLPNNQFKVIARSRPIIVGGAIPNPVPQPAGPEVVTFYRIVSLSPDGQETGAPTDRTALDPNEPERQFVNYTNALDTGRAALKVWYIELRPPDKPADREYTFTARTRKYQVPQPAAEPVPPPAP